MLNVTKSRTNTDASPFPKGTAERFFWDHAGWSYDPKSQTSDEGRKQCAASMAEAERKGREAGLSFEWSLDNETDASFRDTRSPYHLWICVCHDADGLAKSSLGGIDLGRDGSPFADLYRRVVEAELAMEAIAGA